ncbi:MAG: enoyl-CoA hydratase/isomerase family protein [Planctomycetales bacterium]|nr:enoyl-CoA hydratase/isomerase family protein [Planctomycetales bacterium]
MKINGPTGTIILNRPQKCNAMDRATLDSMRQALFDLQQEKRIRGIVITGTGPHFSSGLDLVELNQTLDNQHALQQWYDDSERLKGVVEAILQLPKPVIAAVDGVAFAAGLAIVLACDLVVAGYEATFAVKSAPLGIVSGIVCPLLKFRVGAGLASRLAIGGDCLTATEAKSLGLVHHLVESHLIWVRAQTWVEQMSACPAETLQLSKRLLNEMLGEQLTTELSSAAAAAATSLTTEVASEGLRAFADKRPPKFPS